MNDTNFCFSCTGSPARRRDKGEEGNPYVKPHEVPITWFAAMTTYAGYAVLIMFGHIRDWFGRYAALISRE